MDVKLPKLGEGAETGSVVSLLVKEGDVVSKGQTILELESEKAVAPIPSSAAGRITQIRVKEGDKLSVGQVILTVEDGGAAQPAAKQSAPAPAKMAAAEPEQAEPQAEAGPEGAEAFPAPAGAVPAASPSLRRMARDLGIDLSLIRGSERGGRIVLGDLRAYIQRLQKLAGQARPGAAPATAATLSEPVDFSKWGGITRKPMSSLRKTIARRMAENWNAIPHVTQFDEADITGLMELRKKFAPAYEAKGARLTLTAFALKAVVTALQKHPIFNASLDEAAG